MAAQAFAAPSALGGCKLGRAVSEETSQQVFTLCDWRSLQVRSFWSSKGATC